MTRALYALAFFWCGCVAGWPSGAGANNLIAEQATHYDSSPATWFAGLPTYHAGTGVVPVSPSVPDGSPARDMVSGPSCASPLTFAVYPVNPASSFVVNLTFLDDGGGRKQSLLVGRETISPSFSLPQREVLSVQWIIGAGAVAPLPEAGGAPALVFSFACLSGPNAILSSFALYSSDASDPPITPPALPSHVLPRLTPRPKTVGGADSVSIDLNGEWQFDASPPPAFLDGLAMGALKDAPERLLSAAASWDAISVPSEYTLQGFRVPAGHAVVYQRPFTALSTWTGLCSKLHFDGVYSNATVYVNGIRVGSHLGGFTPFEVDVTAQLAPTGNENVLTVVVVGASLADELSSATAYAAHDLGGITRKVYLFAVPPVSIADVHVITTFNDANYSDVTLLLNVSIANDGTVSAAAPFAITAALSYKDVQEAAGQATVSAPITAGSIAYVALVLQVSMPPLWDPEHPILHDLAISLNFPTPAAETVALRIGFRDVRVVGNRLVINGHPIKARGSTRHETHPLVGRSLWTLEPEGLQWERDIIAFRRANVNWIRTSHYPPPEELMIAADELGMMIELEMPFCWAAGNSGGAALSYTVQVQREALVWNRNHPSVVVYSLGNESPWLQNSNFNTSLSVYLKEVDSSRPFLFDGGEEQPIPPLNLVSVHYPGFDGPGAYANASEPTLFGEIAPLNVYNRREIVTDPGIRDIWGVSFSLMWELVYASPGTLGTCLWSGLDDIFYMPSGEPVGYGLWGVFDSWRRDKPETFWLQQIYSPLKVYAPVPGSSWAPHLVIDNRHDFTDLSEIIFNWSIPESATSGVGIASGGAHSRENVLTLQGLPTPLVGTLLVTATSPRGFAINTWSFALNGAGSFGRVPPSTPSSTAAVAPSVEELPDGRLLIQDVEGKFSWFISATGSVSGNTSAGGPLLTSGPTLMVLPVLVEGFGQLYEGMPPIIPYNDALSGWTLESRTWTIAGGAAVVTLTGVYAASAAGAFTLTFDGAAAQVEIAYAFIWTGAAPVSPRQVGLVFSAPPDLAELSWRRTASWAATYPIDHIGRPIADGVPTNVGPVPGHSPRTVSWSADPSPLGGNDFSSTKHNVSAFALSQGVPWGDRTLAFLSDGSSQHARAWVGDAGVFFLTADVSNEGGNLANEHVLPCPTYRAGSVIAGSATLAMGAKPSAMTGSAFGK